MATNLGALSASSQRFVRKARRKKSHQKSIDPSKKCRKAAPPPKPLLRPTAFHQTNCIQIIISYFNTIMFTLNPIRRGLKLHSNSTIYYFYHHICIFIFLSSHFYIYISIIIFLCIISIIIIDSLSFFYSIVIFNYFHHLISL